MTDISITGKAEDGEVGNYWINLYATGGRWDEKSTESLFSATS